MAMQDKLNTALYSARRSAIREFSRRAALVPDCVRLTLGEPDFPTPAPMCEAVGAALSAGETHYIENNGSAALRQAIADFERAQNGMDYAADEVIVTVGATEALFTALFGVVNPGDEVIVPTPAFVLYEQIINLCRGAYVPLDTTADAFQISPRKLEALITPRTKAIVLNSPNNPTGCVLDRASLDTVYRAVRDRDIFVICDDVYRRLVYDGQYHSFAEYRDLRDRLIVVQSFSKPYAMTGWRVGYAAANPQIAKLMSSYLSHSTGSPGTMCQYAAVEALSGPQTAIEKMRKSFNLRRKYLVSRINAMEGVSCLTPQGAFYVMVNLEKLLGKTIGGKLIENDSDFATAFLEKGLVAVTPGVGFGLPNFVRWSYAASMESLAEGCDRLEEFLKS